MQYRPGRHSSTWRDRRKIIMATLLVLAGVLGGTLAVDGGEDLLATMGVRPALAKTEAPDFALMDLEGKKVGLKEYRGKLILLNFWGTWCVPCQWEMGEMEALY